MKKFFAMLLALVFVFALCTAVSASAEEKVKFEEPEILEGLDLDGVKLILVYFWEPKSASSIEEMEKLEKLYFNYRKDGLLIVGAYRETVDQASERLASQIIRDDIDVSFPLVNIDYYTRYKSSTVPSAVFVDKDMDLLPATMAEQKDFFIGNILDTVEQYKNGAFDEYRDNPKSAKTFEMFEDIIKDESNAEIYAEDLMNRRHVDKGAAFFSGTTDYNTWDELVQNRIK